MRWATADPSAGGQARERRAAEEIAGAAEARDSAALPDDHPVKLRRLMRDLGPGQYPATDAQYRSQPGGHIPSSSSAGPEAGGGAPAPEGGPPPSWRPPGLAYDATREGGGAQAWVEIAGGRGGGGQGQWQRPEGGWAATGGGGGLWGAWPPPPSALPAPMAGGWGVIAEVPAAAHSGGEGEGGLAALLGYGSGGEEDGE